jgi:regulator of replication initiation timing
VRGSLKEKEPQICHLSAEVEELKTQITRLQAENQNLRQRLENLETIVVSEVWEKRGSYNTSPLNRT